MSAPTSAGRLIGRAVWTASRGLVRPGQTRPFQPASLSCLRYASTPLVSPSPRCFSTALRSRAGIMPDAEDPKPPQNQPHEPRATQATEITEEEYHERADEFMDEAHDKAEQLQESRQDVEVEYAAGVLTITFPPNGSYVINKQPPNKQIWLSSPISGPKRFDWVLSGESMHQKEGGGSGEWIYLRDGSSLASLLAREVGISIGEHEEPAQSTDPTE